MCKVAADAARGQLPALEPSLPPSAEAAAGGAASATADAEGRGQDVVMVVGSAHLGGG